MGQIRPLQVINFVAKGTIKEGMLSVLAFKRSLSAGILDGGSGEISLDRRAKPQNAAAAAGNRETACQYACSARGQLARRDGMMGGG